MQNENSIAKYKILYLLSLACWSTSGVISTLIPLSAILIVAVRSFFGIFVFIIFFKIKGEKLDMSKVKANSKFLLLSGLCMALNWLAYFMACRYIDVAIACVIIYLAPIVTMMCSPFFGEKIHNKSVILIFIAFIGVVLTSGFDGTSIHVEPLGLILSFVGVFAYAGNTVFCKKLTELNNAERCIPQIIEASIITVPLAIFTTDFTSITYEPSMLWLLWIILIPTALGYGLYYWTVAVLPVRFVSIFSYIEPVLVVIWSALFIDQILSVSGAVGCIFILGSAILSETPMFKPKKNE